ncbi:MAG: T9SS type A sorting domain-containing protein [Bacteroidales bacterium]|nr:T9SS type A sorting domain-containing protein [Bacteroidales bacterium]
MKKLLFISMLLMTTTVLFGQTVKISSDPAQPCVGDSATFTATIDIGAKTTYSYKLFRNSHQLERVADTLTTHTFNTVMTEAGNYYATVKYGGETYTSDTIVVSVVQAGESYETICAGTTFNWNGSEYDVTGIYFQHLQSSAGCDSTATLHLTVLAPIENEFDAATCEGTPYIWDGRSYTRAGDYPYTYTTPSGCDSIVTLHLKVNQPTSSMTEQSICAGETFDWNGQHYSESGTYTFETLNSNGCDSVATLKLTVLPQKTSTEEVSVCPGESFDWNGQSYSEAGTYTATFEAANGCDSIATLILTVKKMTEVKISGDPTLCHNSSSVYAVNKIKNGSYDWNVEGGTITNGNETNKITVLWNSAGEGKVTVTVENADGCTASDTLKVNVSSYVETVNGVHVKATKDNVSYMLIYMNPETGLKYQWYKDEVAIPGATSQYYMVEAGLPEGAYKVYVSYNESDGNLFCGAFSETVNITATEKTRYTLFPNPAGEGTELSLAGVNEKVTVSIYSIDGRMIRRFIVEGNGKLPVRLSNGCYFVEIVDAQQNKQVEKLIIK